MPILHKKNPQRKVNVAETLHPRFSMILEEAQNIPRSSAKRTTMFDIVKQQKTK